jgi:hypothetical protein
VDAHRFAKTREEQGLVDPAIEDWDAQLAAFFNHVTAV